MISCEQLFKVFLENDLTFFTGVPDSTFKDWMSFLADEHSKRLTNIISCNECEATAIAAGYNLATNKIGVVYMQNSGEGKAVNPLTSLCDKEVYSIPMIMMIGWRGKPGEKDEPQHKKMGRVTIPLLDVLEIPHITLSDNLEDISKQIKEIKTLAEKESKPVAVIIQSGLFEEYLSLKKDKSSLEMRREDAIKLIVDTLDGSEVIISTTGKTSRELFEYRVFKNEEPSDFYTVGSMGCASSIANSIALQKPSKKVLVFDGDGATIMQLGALATTGHYKPKNLLHFIFDNQSHDSTGGQPTVSNTLDFCKVAIGCGYNFATAVSNKKELLEILKNKREGPGLIVVKVSSGSRKDLGRPTKTPLQNKEAFMKKL
jgi:phosphonopyruvate decarboxylase